MIDWLLEPFRFSFMQTGLAAAAMGGVTCAAPVAYVVLRRMAFIGLHRLLCAGLAGAQHPQLKPDSGKIGIDRLFGNVGELCSPTLPNNLYLFIRIWYELEGTMNTESSQEHTTQPHIAAVFDRAAAAYDQVGPPFFAHFGRRLVELAGCAPGELVLDIATGRGAALFPAGAAVGPAGHVTGIDFAPAMIAATRAEVAARGSANITLQPMDAATLDFDDATFDAVVCGFAVFYLPDPLAALREWQRVLKPGGRLALSTWLDPFGPELQWLEPLQRTVLPPPAAPAGKDAEAPVFDTPAGLTALLARAGFTTPTVHVETARFVYADEETWWAWLWSHGIRDWLETVEREQGAAALQRFKEDAFAQLRAGRQADGFPQTSSALLARATRATAGAPLSENEAQ